MYKLRNKFVPVKKSFYFYVLFLAFLNICQSVGSGLLYYRVNEGLCVVDVTTCIYFTLFTPLVYYTFLSEFFGWVPCRNWGITRNWTELVDSLSTIGLLYSFTLSFLLSRHKKFVCKYNLRNLIKSNLIK